MRAKLVEAITGMERARPLTGKAADSLDTDAAGFVMIPRRVPARRGKWQILPPDICN